MSGHLPPRKKARRVWRLPSELTSLPLNPARAQGLRTPHPPTAQPAIAHSVTTTTRPSSGAASGSFEPATNNPRKRRYDTFLAPPPTDTRPLARVPPATSADPATAPRPVLPHRRPAASIPQQPHPPRPIGPGPEHEAEPRHAHPHTDRQPLGQTQAPNATNRACPDQEQRDQVPNGYGAGRDDRRQIGQDQDDALEMRLNPPGQQPTVRRNRGQNVYDALRDARFENMFLYYQERFEMHTEYLRLRHQLHQQQVQLQAEYERRFEEVERERDALEEQARVQAARAQELTNLAQRVQMDADEVQQSHNVIEQWIWYLRFHGMGG